MGQTSKVATTSGIYQKQLAGLQPQQVGNGWQNVGQSGLNLAKSLGVLSETVYQNVLQKEQRLKVTGEQQAAAVMNKASLEDLQTEDAVNLLTKLGVAELANNPYAIANANQIRGQRLASHAKNEYNLWYNSVDNKDKPKDAIGAAKQFDDFMKDKFAEYTGDNGYTEQMEAGFFESLPIGEFEAAKNRTAEISAETKDVLTRGLTADVSDLILTYYDKYNRGECMPKDLTSSLQNIVLDRKYASLDVITRHDILDNFVRTVAGSVPDMDTFLALKDVIVEYDPKDNSPVTLGDLVNMAEIAPLARAGAARTYNAHTRDLFEKMVNVAGDPKALDEMVKKLNKNDIEYFTANKEDAVRVYEQRKDVEEKARLAAEAERFNYESEVSYEAQLQGNFQAQLKAVLAGADKDENGNLVAMNVSGFPKIRVDKVNQDGSHSYSERPPTQEELNRLIITTADEIMSSEKPVKKQVNELQKLLSWGCGQGVRGTEAYLLQQGLDQINMENVKNNSVRIPDAVKKFNNIYNYDHSIFSTLFGADVTREMDKLHLLAGGNNIEQGALLYAKCKERATPDQLSKNKEALKWRYADACMVKFSGLDGSEHEGTKILEMNSYVSQESEELAAFLMCSGIDTTTAKQKAMKVVTDKYTVYHNAALPRGIFRSIYEQTGVNMGKRVLDSLLITNKKKNNNWSGVVNIWWDDKTGFLHINNDSYSIEQLQNEAKYLYNANLSTINKNKQKMKEKQQQQAGGENITERYKKKNKRVNEVLDIMATHH